MTRRAAPRQRPARAGLVGRLGPLLTLLLVTGCAGSWTLDIPPGFGVVLGRIELSGFEAREALLDIVREDGAYSQLLRASRLEDFVLVLPPGRYLVTRLSAFADGRVIPNSSVWDLRLGFEVGPEPAVYIGTLRLTLRNAARPEAVVLDEYAATVPALRARYRELGDPIARRLLTGS